MSYKIVLRCVVMLLWTTVGISAFAAHVSFDEVLKATSTALKESDAKKLGASFNDNVNLSVKRVEGTFTKFQAERMLDDFFRTNKVEGLKEVQRANNSSTSFVVFSVKTTSKSYRIFIKFVQSDKEFKISEIRIE